MYKIVIDMDLLLIICVLLLLLYIAAWQDYKNYHISNMLVFIGTLSGISLNVLLTTEVGLVESIAGWGVGLLLLLPFYLLRMMAAGDVKLMAMVGAFLGPYVIVDVLLYVMIAGGLQAMGMAYARGILQRLISDMLMNPLSSIPKHLLPRSSLNKEALETLYKLPYGVAIAAGTTVFLATNNYLSIPHH